MTPGDLVITEVHANPDGSDGDGEYIELFNPSGAMVALEGLTMVSSRDDGTGVEEHRFGEGRVEAGAYFILGNVAPASTPAHVDYGYGDTLGSLRNSDAALSIRCGGTVVDRVGYASTRDGRALEFDGGLAPDHVSNDDPSHWCFTPKSGSEVLPGNFGTPGARNSACDKAPLDGACSEGGARRAIEHPSVGGVRITEWMPNPNGADGELEWVELLFTKHTDMNGLRLGTQGDTLGAPVFNDACLPVDAGTQVVFGASPAAAPRVDANLDFSLGNGGERSIVVAVGDTVIDRVDYVGSEEGVAWQVDLNGALCLVDALAEHEYLTDNFGTPGERNPECSAVLEEGQCLDGGSPRSIRSPAAGQVQITEWMANPSAVDNRHGEWVEVRFATAADLNGLLWSDLTGTGSTVEREECLTVVAGGYAVFARNPNIDENGGVPSVIAELGISLNNSDETISISVAGEVLDSVSYEAAEGGVATQVDASGFSCHAITPYGEGDLGTPGAPNSSCP